MKSKEELFVYKTQVKKRLDSIHSELEEVKEKVDTARSEEVNKLLSLLVLAFADVEALTYEDDWKEKEHQKIKEDLESKIDHMKNRLEDLKK